jgi:hypothetical protein
MEAGTADRTKLAEKMKKMGPPGPCSGGIRAGLGLTPLQEGLEK